jgi:hypothetical protein
MLSTGNKGEMMASIFVIASNDFMTELHDGKQEGTCSVVHQIFGIERKMSAKYSHSKELVVGACVFLLA